MKLCVMLLPLLLHLLGAVWAYEEGGPISICADPVAWHETNPQKSASPVTITVNANSYTLSGTLQVKLSGKKFEGFMLGAKRVKGDTEELLGTWLGCSGGPTVRKINWFPSANYSSNCITQAKDKSTSSMTCNWQAPWQNAGDIYFRAAIVTDYEEFWTNVMSSTIKAPSVTYPAGYISTTSYTTDYKGDLSTASCGSTKGCVSYPRGCSGTDCEALVVYSVSGTNLDVAMMGKATGYISLGFSSDTVMGNDETVTCAVNPNNKKVEVQRGVNVGYVNNRLRYTVMSNMEGKLGNGIITCRFIIPLDTTATTYDPTKENNYNKPVSLSFKKGNPQYLFFAVGDLWSGTSAVKQHVKLPFLTSLPIDLKSKASHSFESLPIAVKVHGVLLMLAWFGLVLPFAQLPAHMRNNIGMDPMWRSWIRLHIGGLVSAVIIAVAGVITALVYRKGIAKQAVVHAVFGIASTVLGIAQLIMGFVRPAPGTPNKPIFDLVHLINAAIISVVTVTAMYLASNMEMVHPFLRMLLNIMFGLLLGTNISFIVQFRVRRQVVYNCLVNKANSHQQAMQPTVTPVETGEPQVQIQPAEPPARPQMTTHIPTPLYIAYVVINSVLVLIAIILLFLY